MIRAVLWSRSCILKYCSHLFSPVCAYRLTPLAGTIIQSRQSSTRWTANQRVFPGFDLSLLDQVNEEPPKSYEPQAIHTYPAAEEEVLHDRYQIVRKIGYGPTATAWIAIDLTKGGLVVLKIYVVENVLKAYGRVHSPQNYPRNEYPFRKVIDRFVIKGTEGKHICIVHEAPSLESNQMGSDTKMDLESMRVSIRQLLILLDYLHTDCNLTARIDHGVGVHPTTYREAYPDSTHRVDELATELLPGDGVPLLADFSDEDERAGLVAKHLRTPEEILRSHWDYKVDIWSTAMVAWDFVSSRNLINGRNQEGAFDDRVHIADLVALLGPPTSEFRNKMPLGPIFWDEKGQWTGQTSIPDRSLEGLASGELDGEDLTGFLHWMRMAMQWDPADRPTALGLMRHEWMARDSVAQKDAGESTESASA